MTMEKILYGPLALQRAVNEKYVETLKQTPPHTHPLFDLPRLQKIICIVTALAHQRFSEETYKTVKEDVQKLARHLQELCLLLQQPKEIEETLSELFRANPPKQIKTEWFRWFDSTAEESAEAKQVASLLHSECAYVETQKKYTTRTLKSLEKLDAFIRRQTKKSNYKNVDSLLHLLDKKIAELKKNTKRIGIQETKLLKDMYMGKKLFHPWLDTYVHKISTQIAEEAKTEKKIRLANRRVVAVENTVSRTMAAMQEAVDIETSDVRVKIRILLDALSNTILAIQALPKGKSLELEIAFCQLAEMLKNLQSYVKNYPVECVLFVRNHKAANRLRLFIDEKMIRSHKENVVAAEEKGGEDSTQLCLKLQLDALAIFLRMQKNKPHNAYLYASYQKTILQLLEKYINHGRVEEIWPLMNTHQDWFLIAPYIDSLYMATQENMRAEVKVDASPGQEIEMKVFASEMELPSKAAIQVDAEEKSTLERAPLPKNAPLAVPGKHGFLDRIAEFFTRPSEQERESVLRNVRTTI